MKTITKDNLLKALRKNALIGIGILLTLSIICIGLTVYFCFTQKILYAIGLLVFDVPMLALLFKLVVTCFQIRYSKLRIVEDTLIAKNKAAKKYSGNDNGIEYIGKYAKSGDITMLGSEYERSEVDDKHYLIFVGNQKIPIATYTVDDHEFDEDLKKIIT